MTRRWVNGQAVVVDGSRACLYGDGLFETMVFRSGHLCWWSHHWLRLQTGLQRLGYSALSEAVIWESLTPALSALSEDSVIRLSVTRRGVRGYRAEADAEIVIDVQVSPLPTNPWHGQLIHVRWCHTQWAQQPLLAGIKHMNRLEQVLARSEWSDVNISEGLVCDTQGRVVSGTMSAIMLRFGHSVLAADISQSGIDSVARRLVLDALPSLGYEPMIQPLSKKDVMMADEILMMNVVQGIAAVADCDGVKFSDFRLAETLTPLWQKWQVSN
jgi:4-amino-4-deoxychorismate lyase